MLPTNDSILCLKNIDGDRYVNRQYALTRHATERKIKRSFKNADIVECLERGVSTLGHSKEDFKSRRFKNTTIVLRKGKYVEATIVYVLEKDANSDYEKVCVITVYYTTRN